CAGVKNETSPCEPATPYGVFKLASEGVCRYFAEITQTRLIVLRFTQLYGLGEPHGSFLQRVFLPEALRGGQISLTRGGRDEKDLLWVEDAATAIVQTLVHPGSGTYNISTGKGVSVFEIASLLQRFVPRPFALK